MKGRLKFAVGIPAVLLALVFVLTLGFAVSDSAAYAAESRTATADGTISFAQMSDIHYFPIEYAYTDVAAENYPDSDFYYSMTGDTKLVLESGAILNANIRRIIAAANEGAAPQYMFATGDLSKNGERVALIDVANALRYLQNEMRKIEGYENFQVFVTPGNHDLYNGSGAVYSAEDGSSYQAEAVTPAQFALIFAGLGYPDATLEGGNDTIKLTDFYPAEYWSSGYTGGYVESHNAGNLTITYFKDDVAEHSHLKSSLPSDRAAIGENINELSYRVEAAESDFVFFVLDSHDREPADKAVPVRVSEAEIEILGENAAYYAEDSAKDSAVAVDRNISYTEALEKAAAGEPVYADTGWNHITGGRLCEPVLNWMREYTADNQNKTYIVSYHHNALPHFEQEDDILKDFVFYNWEYIAKSFLEMGVRYGLAGHMHASDVAYYTDAAGRTFYELETGSSVSFDSPIRTVTVDRYSLDGGALGEKFTTQVYRLDSLKETASTNIRNAKEWNQAAFEAAYADYTANKTEENWQKVVDSNPDYFAYMLHYDKMSDMSYNDYITDEIYGPLVDRIVDHFINEKTIEDLNLADTVLEILPGIIANAFGNTVGKAVDYLQWAILYDLYEVDTMEWLKVKIDGILDMEFGQEGHKLTLSQMASFIMMAHTGGLEPAYGEVFGEALSNIEGTAASVFPTDPVYRASFIAALKDFSDKCDSGELGRNLIGTLLDALWYDDDALLKTLLAYEFDFTSPEANFTEDEIGTLKSAFFLLPTLLPGLLPDVDLDLSGLNLSVDHFVLGEIADDIWSAVAGLLDSLLGFSLPGNSIDEALNTFLDSYLTDSFYVGLSGIARNIVVAFATDDERDNADVNDPTKPYVLSPHDGYASEYASLECGRLTYVGGMPVADDYNPATRENGRLPSALTANFNTEEGKNGSEYMLSFYTAEEIGAEVTLYDEDGAVIGTATVTEDDLNTSFAAGNYFRETEKTGEQIILKGETRPQYIPLIDLGLLCITHGEVEIENEDGTVTPYDYRDRNSAQSNSVIYKNKWNVTFHGLEAGKTYRYTVAGVYGEKTFDLAKANGADYFTLATAPDESTTDFDFLAIADMQGMIEAMYEKSAAAVKAAADYADGYGFVLNAGDMADNGKNFYQWQWALDSNVDFFANTSTFTAAGNHEADTDAFDRFYTYDSPAGDGVVAYSFDYATAHVIVLDTNDATAEDGLGKAQLDWLKADLEANSDAKWTFVLMHKSLYSGGSHSYDGEVVKMREQLVPLFYEYGVDIVFGGHDHTYTVTQFLDGEGNAASRQFDDSDSITADGSGVLYVTLGTIGTKFYEYVSNPAVESKFDIERSILGTLTDPTFAKISVRGDTLTFEGCSVDESGTVTIICRSAYDPFAPALGIGLGIACVWILTAVCLIIVDRKRNGKAKK